MDWKSFLQKKNPLFQKQPQMTAQSVPVGYKLKMRRGPSAADLLSLYLPTLIFSTYPADVEAERERRGKKA